MSELVRYIHTQEQAQAELVRLDVLDKAYRDRRKQRLLNNPQFAQQDREMRSQRTRNNRNKKRNLSDSENSWQVIHEMNSARQAKSRKIAKDKQFIQDVQEQQDMIEKVQQRY